MKSTIKRFCPCGSGQKYKRCCQVFHQGVLPSNALELMKSRYSAYVVGDSQYIISTTHKNNNQYLTDFDLWEQQIKAFVINTDFKSLTILDVQEAMVKVFVTFRVDAVIDHQPIQFIEKSEFIQEQGRWYYLNGSEI